MQTDSHDPVGKATFDDAGSSPPRTEETKLVRLLKSIAFNPAEPGAIDSNIVTFRYYNSFNYSLLSKEQKEVNLTIGVTSPNSGSGKTLVASNLAVSLALGYQRKTILVDLNLQKPRLHEIFGTPLHPGLSEAFYNGTIHVSRTQIEDLYVLASGHHAVPPIGRDLSEGLSAPWPLKEPPVGLRQMAAFRDVIYSLQQEFEFIIVDMPSIDPRNFPILFANQLSGILLVLHAGKTKREEVDTVFRELNQHYILGFVLNHFDENSI